MHSDSVFGKQRPADTPDIEALVAALRGNLIPLMHPNMTAHTKRMAICLSAAGALERQQAVVDAAREVAENVIGFCVALREDKPCWRDHPDAGVLYAKARAFLAALDAPPGEG